MTIMKISIVIPALNEAAAIGATLALLAPLRARGHEVIVADGGSEDAVCTVPTGAQQIDPVPGWTALLSERQARFRALYPALKGR